MPEPGKRARGSLRRGDNDLPRRRNSPTPPLEPRKANDNRLAYLCRDHEKQEWRDTYYRNRRFYDRIPQAVPVTRQEGPSQPQSTTSVVRTIGVLEIKAKVNQYVRDVILDTGACVSCIDESLVSHSKDKIRPVLGMNVKTATDEPVQIIGRTDIVLEISCSVIIFPMFVARGVGGCCILGNDFHLKYGTLIDFARRTVQITVRERRMITVDFYSQEKDAKYLQPPPDLTWLRNIQFEEVSSSRPQVVSVGATEIPPRSHRLLKIKYEGIKMSQDSVGVLEPTPEIFRDKSLIIPYGLIQTPPPDEILVTNLTEEMRQINKDEVVGEIHEVQHVLKDDNLERIGMLRGGATEEEFKEEALDINPNLTPERRKELVTLLREFKDRFAWNKDQIGRTNVCELSLPLTSTEPVHQPPYRVSHREREIIRQQVDDMLRRGVIRESSSAYASPVVLVRKKNDEWRFCVDYRKLNLTLKDMAYPLPLIGDILTYMNGCKHFCTLDMNSGYWQIPIREEDKHKTAFITADGLYEWQVTPFGLKTSPGVFQKCMDQVLAGLKWGSCLVYLDDVLIMAPEYEIMLKRLETVLERLRAASMTLNPAKCSFGYGEVQLLGHVVNEQGISPNPSKLKAVREFPPPRRLRALRAFIGLCNYYRSFVPDFSKIVAPLVQLTRKDAKFHWGPEQETAFAELKGKLTTAPILRHFDPKLPLELHTDASDLGVGAALMQREEDRVLPVAYGSRRLSDAEKKYTTTEKECIAVVWATQYFRQFLWGQKFTIVVDHHALCWLDRNKDMSGRVGRWALKLMEFQYKIKHKQGRLHVVPDCLSRNPCSDCGAKEEAETNDIPLLKLELSDIRDMQREDEECNRIYEAVQNPAKASSADRRLERSFIIENGVLYKKNIAHMGHDKLLVVPKRLRNEILFECHDSPLSGAHLGFSKTFFKIKSRYYWPHMVKDTEKYVQSCHDCQTRKTPKRAPAGLLQPIPVGQPWDRVGIDFLGPFNRTKAGKKFIIVAIDYATKWVEAEATRSNTAEETAKFLINKIICKYGCPGTILSDRGSNFTSTLVTELLKGLGIRPSFTTAYHPMCNGLVEHFNGTLAQMLSFYVSTDQKDWDLYINLTCFSYNTSRQDTTKHTPFYLMFGREAKLPIDVSLRPVTSQEPEAEELIERVHRCRQDVQNIISREQKRQKARFDRLHRPVDYQEDQQVMVWTPVKKKGRSTKLLHRWHGPYRIVRKLSELNYEVQISPRGKRIGYIDTIHVSRLKPYYTRGE